MASSSTRSLVATLGIALTLGCGGGSDGGPADIPVIVLSAPMVTLAEGTPETLTVVLDAAPPANVSVALTSGAGVTVVPTTLDFTPANFDIPKSIILTPVQDADLADGSDTVTATAAGLVTVKLPVAITDDDDQGILLDTDSLVITEGDTASFTVRLAFQPAASVTVDFGPLDSNVTVSQSAALFSPANWDTPVRVTVTAHHDTDLGNEATFVVAGIATGPNAIVYVTVDDEDVQALIVDPDSLVITEGDTASFTVRLAYQPAGSVVVDFGPLDTNVTVSQSAALFSPSNWDTPVRVTVTAHHDTDLGGEPTFVAAGIAGGPNAIVIVFVVDDDLQSIVADQVAFNVTEGDTAPLGLRLAFQPGSDLTINAASLNNVAATVSPSSRTFSPANWDTYQYVTVSGTQDADAAAAATTARLSGLGVANKDVSVNVTDNDQLGIESTIATISVAEGSTAEFGVRLTAQPAGDFVVSAASADGTAATVQAPTTLTFTTANWSTYQAFTIQGTQDVDLAAESTTIGLTGSGVPGRTVTVNVTDDDTQAFVVSVDTIFVTEGASTQVTISLAYQPPSNVTASLSIDALVATSSSSILASFTPANYFTGFSITIRGTEDVNTVTDGTVLSIQAAGVPMKIVLVIVADND